MSCVLTWKPLFLEDHTMNTLFKSYLTSLLILIGFANLIAQQSLQREFRGAWIATVGNIDWPSSKNLSSEEQKKEFIGILDMCKSLNFNAVIFQIRPSADAFYNSRYEPWSKYLTGTNGEAPSPYYDPLSFVIEETHKRGMEFHAWLNPYRAVINYKEYQSNPNPLTYEHPEWFVNYGDNKYFDPGNPEVREYTLKVVTDVVQNYNIDAIHFDDYFYPYKIAGVNFPDTYSFKSFGASYFPNNLDEWRRNNVNLIIQELQARIKMLKPWVQFGISPFGVWRNDNIDPRGSSTQAGQTNYDDLYADILHWVKKGWIDYLLPQAYWHIGHEKADYAEVVKWWSENSFGTHLYIGHGTYKMTENNQDASWRSQNPTEIEKQLKLNKSISKISGSVFFSSNTLMENPLKIRQKLSSGYFSNVVLPPVTNPDIKNTPQPVRRIRIERTKGKSQRLVWNSVYENEEKKAVKYLVDFYHKQGAQTMNEPSYLTTLTGHKFLDITKSDLKDIKRIVIRAVSRNNDVSDPVSFTP